MRPKLDHDALARSAVGTVRHWAGRHYRGSVRRAGGTRDDLDDLVSAGWLGVATALKKFDPARGVKFNTLATWWVRSAVNHEARRITRRLVAERGRVSLLCDRSTAGNPEVYETDRRAADPTAGHDLDCGLDAIIGLAATRLQRAVLRRHFRDGMTYQQAGRRLGRSTSSVRLTAAAGLAACRERLRAGAG